MTEHESLTTPLREIGECLLQYETMKGFGCLLLTSAHRIRTQAEIIGTLEETFRYATELTPGKRSPRQNPWFTVSVLEGMLSLHEQTLTPIKAEKPEIYDNEPYRLALIEAIACVRLVNEELLAGFFRESSNDDDEDSL